MRVEDESEIPSPEMPPGGGEEETGKVPASGKPELVIVDDETDILDMLSEDFTAAGYQVWCAENISSGLALINGRRPAMVITDLDLPLGDGKDLLDEVLGIPLEIRPKIAFITGNPMVPVESAYDLGVEGYIMKPFDRGQVVGYVKWLCMSSAERWTQYYLGNIPPTTKIVRKFPSVKAALDSGEFALGRGGFFVAMPEDLPDPSDLVDFVIEFENDPNMKISGDGFVRWNRQQGPHGRAAIGVEFRNLDRKTISALLFEAKILESVSYIPLMT